MQRIFFIFSIIIFCGFSLPSQEDAYLNINVKEILRHVNDIEADIQHYYTLPFFPEDQNNITQLITELADSNLFSLLLKKRKMEKLGNKLQSVHPLCFIGYIHLCPHLRKRLAKIKKNTFKWKNFIRGFGTRMLLEHSNNNLFQYLSGFSHATKIPLQNIKHYVAQQDWEGLVVSTM